MSKRMPWWGYVRSMLVRYPTDCTEDERRAVELAIRDTQKLDNGAEHMKLIRLVFFSGDYTLQGAAALIPCSYETAKRWQQHFIWAVASHFRCERLTTEAWK